MNKALLCIGSNRNGEINLKICRTLLEKVFPKIIFFDILITRPYGEVYKYNFTNQLVLLETSGNQTETGELLKNLEKKIGRNPEDKKRALW